MQVKEYLYAIMVDDYIILKLFKEEADAETEKEEWVKALNTCFFVERVEVY